MSNAHAFINGRQYPRTDVSLVIGDVARELEINGLDYTEGAEAGLHLSALGEEKLLQLLGRAHFERSFDIHVTYAQTDTAPLTEDRLIDCRLRRTGSRPVQMTVMFVQHGRNGGGF
jgi:hypothetical protein